MILDHSYNLLNLKHIILMMTVFKIFKVRELLLATIRDHLLNVSPVFLLLLNN